MSDGGQTVGLVLDRSSFFSQAGGQVADVGQLVLADGGEAAFRVTSVQTFGGYVLHIGTLEEGRARSRRARVSSAARRTPRRGEISKSHTLTHAINLALHQVLGDGVNQKGSLVDERRHASTSAARPGDDRRECERVEGLVREMVGQQLPVHIETVPLDKALEINNLRAVFGERYPDPVRVVSIGPTVPELLAEPESKEWEAYSIELCGGTHIPSTDTLGGFALVEETAVASRRAPRGRAVGQARRRGRRRRRRAARAAGDGGGGEAEGGGRGEGRRDEEGIV